MWSFYSTIDLVKICFFYENAFFSQFYLKQRWISKDQRCKASNLAPSHQLKEQQNKSNCYLNSDSPTIFFSKDFFVCALSQAESTLLLATHCTSNGLDDVSFNHFCTMWKIMNTKNFYIAWKKVISLLFLFY